MEKWQKIMIILISLILLAIGLWIINSFFGNPVSKMVAKSSGQKYIDTTYSGEDFIIEEVYYNFKDGAYNVMVVSPSSIDTHFSLVIPFNKVVRDTYEEHVVGGWNTYERIAEEYRQMVDGVFLADDFPIESDIDFGTIEIFDEQVSHHFDEADYGIQIEELELDKIYDVKELAEKVGHIVYYVKHDEITFEKASEYILIIKNELDEAEVPFHAIDFVLTNPKEDTGRPYDDNASIHTANLLYDDIYEEGLAPRIEENHQQLMEYYEQQDEAMK